MFFYSFTWLDIISLKNKVWHGLMTRYLCIQNICQCASRTITKLRCCNWNFRFVVVLEISIALVLHLGGGFGSLQDARVIFLNRAQRFSHRFQLVNEEIYPLLRAASDFIIQSLFQTSVKHIRPFQILSCPLQLALVVIQNIWRVCNQRLAVFRETWKSWTASSWWLHECFIRRWARGCSRRFHECRTWSVWWPSLIVDIELSFEAFSSFLRSTCSTEGFTMWSDIEGSVGCRGL